MTHATPNTVHINDDDIQLAEAAVALKDAAVELGSHARATARAARRELMLVADSHPYALAGSAAGVGFVVAGGLTAPATRALVSMGLKLGSAFVLDAAISAIRGPLKNGPVGGGPKAPSSDASSAGPASTASTGSSSKVSSSTGSTEQGGEGNGAPDPQRG